MKKTGAILPILSLALILILSSCGLFGKKEAESGEEPGATQPVDDTPRFSVAVLLPNRREHKWIRSGDYIVAEFERWSYGVELLDAADNAELQALQMEDAVASGADCIIIAACDSYSPALAEAAEDAKEAGVPVIAYDRLIMDTEGIGCYIAFDPYLAGRLCGLYLEEALNPYSETKNIEVLIGSRADSRTRYFYSGAMDVLMPHIDAGRLKVLSGVISYERVRVEGPEKARQLMASRLEQYYGGEGVKVDAVLTSSDELALGAIEALEDAGYGSEFPFVVGVGCHSENMIKLQDGKQSMSLFEDERESAKVLAEAADLLIHDIIPVESDRTTFDNGAVIVPAVLSQQTVVDKSNYKDLLIGGEYYSYTDINP